MSRIKLDGTRCVYCGEGAGTVDHFPPRSAMDNNDSGFLLPACIECNTIASTEYPFDFAKRASFVKRRIKERYRHLDSHAEWTEDEIKELGYSLRAKITAWGEAQRVFDNRIDFDSIAYLSILTEQAGSGSDKFRGEIDNRKKTNCPFCGKRFVQANGKMFCSISCRGAMRAYERGDPLSRGVWFYDCAWCSKKYVGRAKGSDASVKFCSTSCRTKSLIVCVAA
jgi:endogenous inhibitor of DNA gyrase (YacG/DUF329 family)